MKKLTILFLSFLCLTHLYAQNDPYAVQDRDLGSIHARHAWNAYGSSRWSDFRSLTARGLEYDSENSDLLCFRGIDAVNQGLYGEAYSWFSKAYYSGMEPEILDRTDIMAWLFETGYRLGLDRELEDLYATGGEMVRDDADILFYSALSRRRMGEDADAAALAKEGLYRYQDQRFLILLSSWISGTEYPGILSEYIARQGILYPDLLARFVLNGENHEALASLYIEQFNDLNSWYFRKVLLDLPPSGWDGSCDADRVWPLNIYSLYIAEKGVSPDCEGTLRLDGSGDGLEDILIDGNKGRLRWTIDPDQDGLPDSVLNWEGDSRLLSVEEHGPGRLLEISYYDYPYVDRVMISSTGGNRREYLFLPGGFGYPLTSGEGDARQLLLARFRSPLGGFLPESDLLKSCYSLIDSVTREDLRPFREYTVVDGSIRRFREDSNLDGRFDRVVLIENWLPYEGFRDIDGSGVFDLKERYIDGRLAGFEYEGDNTRLEEYQDLWNRNRFQLWDFSKDNFYDAYLRRREDGSWTEILFTGEE